MARARITESDYARVAKRLNCDVPAVKAVTEVESAGAGFLGDERPKILYERHIFSRLTQGRFDASHPDLSSSRPGGYANSTGEWTRYYRALQLDAEAAAQSCSWGLMQIMGFNWKLCGEKSLLGFLMAAHHNEAAHLNLFAEFILNSGLANALRSHDWSAFARGYNGPAYAKNRYDSKLASAFRRHGGSA